MGELQRMTHRVPYQNGEQEIQASEHRRSKSEFVRKAEPILLFLLGGALIVVSILVGWLGWNLMRFSGIQGLYGLALFALMYVGLLGGIRLCLST